MKTTTALLKMRCYFSTKTVKFGTIDHEAYPNMTLLVLI